MNLKQIDLDKLQDYAFKPFELAMVEMASNEKFINIKCLDNESIVPTVKAISLDRIKQASEEIDKLNEDLDGYDPHALGEYASRVSEILDKLIAESEET